MAFYQDVKPKKMTRKDHLRQESTWEEEGTRYRRSTGKSDEQRRENAEGKTGFRKAPAGNGCGHADKGGWKKDGDFGRKPVKTYQHEKPRDEKPVKTYQHEQPRNKKPARNDRPQRPEAPKPAPKAPARTAPVQERDPAFLPPENLLSGRNPIREAIRAGRDIEKLMVAKGDLSATAQEIIAMARDAHIPIQTVDRSRLDEITKNHQGMLAFASAYRYYDVEDMLAEAEEKKEVPFLIVLDGVTDPQNLGAIIRTAACVGAHGVIVPERRAVGLTPSAVKASAGAIECVKVARVTNLTRTLQMLKEKGVWLFAADMVGEDYRKVDFSGPIALIIGAEGEGVSRLVLETCDHRVSLPMRGGVGSLNASVAAGVMMYAALNSRL